VPWPAINKDSEVFRDMRAIPSGPNTPKDGTNDNRPIRLDGIRKDDFRQLLRILYPSFSHPRQLDNLTVTQWVSVLKLATMWSFSGVRASAVDALTAMTIEPVEKVRLAVLYDVPQWLLPAFVELARRPKPPTLAEARILGLETVTKLAEVRESLPPVVMRITSRIGGNEFLHCSSCAKPHGSKCPLQEVVTARASHDFAPVVRSVFQLK
jgi:hypothetical protein